MNENEGKPTGLNLNLFLKDLDTIRHEYHITVTNKITPDIQARRVAILIANCYLTHGGNVHQAGFLERDIYEAVRMLALCCDPIPDEIRIEELSSKQGKREVYRSFNPLKLSIEGKESYLTTYTSLVAFIIQKLNTIEEKEDGRISKRKSRRLAQRRTTQRVLQSKKFNHKTLEDKRRIALCQVGGNLLCSGTGFHELVHGKKRVRDSEIAVQKGIKKVQFRSN